MKKIPWCFSILLLSTLWVSNVFAWEVEHPSGQVYFTPADRVENLNTDSEASVGIGVDISEYEENLSYPPFDGHDGVRLRVSATANTRKGVTYLQTTVNYFPVPWVNAPNPTGVTDDNTGAWVDLSFPVFFYGGPGTQNKSAYYRRVWVSDNGFLSFDSPSNSPSPKPIPDSESPNTLLAAYWSDLDPAGASINYYGDQDTFVVMWDNVLNKQNGNRQTFEVIIESFMVPGGGRGQNRIRFLYKKGVTWCNDAVVGIEDQEGYKGTTCARPNSGQTVTFTSTRESGEIRELAIKLTKSDSNALVYFDTDESVLRGLNLRYTSETPESVPTFGFGVYDKAIGGYVTLLVSTAVGLSLGPVGGIMFGVTRIGILDLAPALARAQWPAHELDRKDALHFPNEDFAYINASADYSYGWPVDAILSAPISWVFADENAVDHSVSITAELKYYSYVTHQIVTLPTQAQTLRFLRDSNTISDARDIGFVPARVRGYLGSYMGMSDEDDYFGFHVSTSAYQTLTLTMTPPADSDFDIELIRSGSLIGSSYNVGLGVSESIQVVVQPCDDTYFHARIRWRAGAGFYNLTISLLPYSAPPGGGGGGGGLPPLNMLY